MEDGSKKPICEVKEGDKVWTFNEKKRIKEILPVKEVFRNLSKHEKMYEIELEDHTVLKITGNHKVLTKNRGYVRVDKLNENDDILNFYFSSNHDAINKTKNNHIKTEKKKKWMNMLIRFEKNIKEMKKVIKFFMFQRKNIKIMKMD